MVRDELKNKSRNLIKKAEKNGLKKSYADFCNSDEAKEYALTEEEIVYYTSRGKGDIK